MLHALNPILLYGACALGALGVWVCLPKKSPSPFVIGGLLAAIAFGLVMVGLGWAVRQSGGAPQLPNYHFYIFSAIALGAAIRVISHPRPVYAALYFVLTVLATCGLYLILSAEFMAFALVIVYAGAILITYLFVIMLATEAPSADSLDSLAEYDRVAREPLAATIAGFVLLAALSTLLTVGASRLSVDPALAAAGDANLQLLPKKVESALRDTRDAEGKPFLHEGEGLVFDSLTKTWQIEARADGEGFLKVADQSGRGAAVRTIAQKNWPTALRIDNVEGVAFSLLGGHPGAIEIAGVILLMAMLGAVVLARKKVEIDEATKAAAASRVGLMPGPGQGGTP
ncbi:MAG: NADH-quinone oxidoreductase subunit J [Phycisphaerales bacterium]